MPSGLPEPPEANRSIVIAMGDIKNSLTALLILVIIALTVGGNILVILAVSLERKLQIATNFFLRSLAVADMLVGILVMPVSLINILYDYEWPLPRPLCPIWIYLDVLFSTASIMHLCTISLDRYVAIRNPIEHSRFNSRTKAMMKIAAVWTISIGISMPIPVIGLYDEKKVFVCKEDTEHTNNNTNNTNNTCVANMCVLNDKDFMLFGSFVAFFIPLVIMVVTYCLTIRVLQRQASVFLYEGNSTSQQPLQPAPPPAATSLLPQIVAPPPEKEAPPPPSRKGSLSFLKGAEPGLLLSASPSDGVSVSEAPSALSSPAGRDPAGCHGRRGMMQAIKNERRASKVLGIVFFLFLIMWCPFFIANVTSVLCHGPKPPVCNNDLLEWLLKVFVWVGYISSGVNPLVYTLFNKTYRHAFSSYIRCRYRPDAASSALGKGPTLCPSHAVTPVMGSEAGGRGRKMLAVDRNSNCRNGGGEAGGNRSVLLGAVEPDEPTDDETEHGGGGGPEEEEAELVSATRAGVAFNGNSRASQEHTSSV